MRTLTRVREAIRDRPYRLLLQLLSLILFGAILWLGGPHAWRQILAGDPRGILPSFLVSGLAGVVAATRLRLVAGTVAGRDLGSWRRFYHLNMTARALGLVVPRSLSVLAGKPVALRTLGLSLKRSLWVVVVDNLFDLGLLGALALPSLLFLKSGISTGGCIALALGLALVLAGGLWWDAVLRRLRSLAGWMARRTALVTALQELPYLQFDLTGDKHGIGEASCARSAVLQALGLSVLLNAALIARFYFIARAVGLTYPWTLFAAAFPVTQLSLVLAVTPGGLGLFDAGWYGVLLLGGVPDQEALTFVIAQRAYVFVFVLAWAGFSALLSLTQKEPLRCTVKGKGEESLLLAGEGSSHLNGKGQDHA